MKNEHEKPSAPVLHNIEVAEKRFETAAESEDIDFYDLQLIKERVLELKEKQDKAGEPGN